MFFSAPLMAPMNLDHNREVLKKRKCVNMICFVPLNIKYTFFEGGVLSPRDPLCVLVTVVFAILGGFGKDSH